MKWLILCCIFVWSSSTFGGPVEEIHTRGCIYIMGKCQRECEEGTHAYATGCSQKMPEATCQQPNPVLEEAIICDYSACYCDAPTVRDPATNKCVKIEDCISLKN